MDSDFHYYGTGTAALQAGFTPHDATLIGNVAQYVDWFNNDYWSFWRMVDAQGNPIKNAKDQPYQYEFPQLSVQRIDWKMVHDYEYNIWNAFHFPPGNLPYQTDNGGWQQAFCEQHVIRQTNLGEGEVDKLCRPFSKFALDLINDTITQFKALSAASGDDLAQLAAQLLAPRERCPVNDGKKLALYFLGVRMHVLADTWAHQDFTGEPNERINAAGFLNYVYAKDQAGEYQETTWTGTIWVLGKDTDCAAAPRGIGSKACAGHGQMGHFPDYSWLHFKYPAAWLPEGTTSHHRDNPKEYNEAWSWLSFVMGLCNGQKSDSDLPESVASDIEEVMNTWHHLSNQELVAIEKSEELWRKTALGKSLPDRWDPEERKPLGLYDGLATTRHSYIHVVQDSTLHYMETAAAMHYQFCVNWCANNPEYSWRPAPPKN